MAVEPGMTPLWLLPIALLGTVVVIDAVSSAPLLGAWRVTAPEISRLGKNRDGAISLRVRPSPPLRAKIRIGAAFPEALGVGETECSLRLTGTEMEFIAGWNCRPRERGQYALPPICIEIPSPWGWWRRRAACPVSGEVRVYPNLLRDRARTAAVFLNRSQSGAHAQRLVGKGRDFEQLREYIHGDDFGDIHWKATARRGHPVTKVYQTERTQEVYVLVDASRMSARRSGAEGDSALDRFLTAALLLGLAAERQGDLFGVGVFSTQVDGFLRAGRGRSHFNACREALYTVQPRLVNPDFSEIFSTLRTRLRRRALLVFLTDLGDPVLAEQFTDHVGLLTRRHLVLVNMLTPPDLRPLFSAHAGSAGEIYSHLCGHIQWNALRETQRILRSRGVPLGLLDNAALCPELIRQYLAVKQRQLL